MSFTNSMALLTAKTVFVKCFRLKKLKWLANGAKIWSPKRKKRMLNDRIRKLDVTCTFRNNYARHLSGRIPSTRHDRLRTAWFWVSDYCCTTILFLCLHDLTWYRREQDSAKLSDLIAVSRLMDTRMPVARTVAELYDESWVLPEARSEGTDRRQHHAEGRPGQIYLILSPFATSPWYFHPV